MDKIDQIQKIACSLIFSSRFFIIPNFTSNFEVYKKNMLASLYKCLEKTKKEESRKK